MSARKKAAKPAPKPKPFASYDEARKVPMTVTAGQIDNLVGFNNYGLDGYGPAALALNALFHGANELKLLRYACTSDDLADPEELSNAIYMLAVRLETAAEIAAKAVYADRKQEVRHEPA
jgi:hypothetical protein